MAEQAPIVIIGTAALARIVADILVAQQSIIYGFLRVRKEDAAEAAELDDIPMLGAVSDKPYQKMLKAEKLEYVIAEQDGALRMALLKQLFDICGRLPMNVVHEAAWLSPRADLAQGAILRAGSVVENGVSAEALVYFGPGAVVEADARLGAAVTLGAGCVVGEGAHLGNEVNIGRGAVLRNGITVGARATIGPGAVVMGDVPEGAILFGNPAKPI